MPNGEGNFWWTEEPFRACHVMRGDGVSIRNAGATMLSKLANTWTVNVWRDTSIAYTMNAPVDYVGLFHLEYGVKLVAENTKDTIDDLQSSY